MACENVIISCVGVGPLTLMNCRAANAERRASCVYVADAAAAERLARTFDISIFYQKKKKKPAVLFFCPTGDDRAFAPSFVARHS